MSLFFGACWRALVMCFGSHGQVLVRRSLDSPVQGLRTRSHIDGACEGVGELRGMTVAREEEPTHSHTAVLASPDADADGDILGGTRDGACMHGCDVGAHQVTCNGG